MVTSQTIPREEPSMIDATVLTEIVSTPAECEVNYPGCEGIATERDEHPTAFALGEPSDEVWCCGSCSYEAARDA